MPASTRIRQAAMAGQWYPGEAEELTTTVDGYLADATVQVPPEEQLYGLLAPHAGMAFSGPTAGWAYRQARGRTYDVVVLFALCHGRAPGWGRVIRLETTALYDGDGFATPLGTVPIDVELATALHEHDAALFPYHNDAHTMEHAVELHLPFLQRALGDVPFVPVLLQTTNNELIERIAAGVCATLGERRALIVASSDLSHRPPYDIARQADLQALEAVAQGDARTLLQRARELDQTPAPNFMCSICGLGATMALLATTRRLGAQQGRVLHYSNSGDTSGMKDEVVGYGAVALVG